MDQNQGQPADLSVSEKTEFYWKWLLSLVGHPVQVPISSCIQSLLTPAATPSIFLTHTLSALILWWFIILLYFHTYIKLTRTQQKLAYNEWDFSENNFWQLILAKLLNYTPKNQFSCRIRSCYEKIFARYVKYTLPELSWWIQPLGNHFAFIFFFLLFLVFGRLGSFPLVCAQLTITSS